MMRGNPAKASGKGRGFGDLSMTLGANAAVVLAVAAMVLVFMGVANDQRDAFQRSLRSLNQFDTITFPTVPTSHTLTHHVVPTVHLASPAPFVHLADVRRVAPPAAPSAPTVAQPPVPAPVRTASTGCSQLTGSATTRTTWHGHGAHGDFQALEQRATSVGACGQSIVPSWFDHHGFGHSHTHGANGHSAYHSHGRAGRSRHP
jgi:hypothetical protein